MSAPIKPSKGERGQHGWASDSLSSGGCGGLLPTALSPLLLGFLSVFNPVGPLFPARTTTQGPLPSLGDIIL